MSARLVQREATVEIDGSEVDVPVRCWVDVRVVDASLDGEPEMLVAGEWTAMAANDVERITDALIEQAVTEEVESYDDRDPGDFL